MSREEDDALIAFPLPLQFESVVFVQPTGILSLNMLIILTFITRCVLSDSVHLLWLVVRVG